MLEVLVYDDPTVERVVECLGKWAKDQKIQVHVTKLPYDELYYKVREHGAKYDLLLIDDPWLPALAEKGDVLRPVTDVELRQRMPQFAREFSEVCYYRKRSPSAGADGPRRPAKEIRECSGKANSPACADIYKGWELYAMPVIGNVQLLLVAADLLPKHKAGDPLSWPQLKHAIIEHDKTPAHSGPGAARPVRFVFRGGSSNAALADFLPFLRAWHANLLNDDNIVTLSKPDCRAREALKFGLELAASFSPVQHARLNDQDVYQLLADDEAEAGVIWLASVSRMQAAKDRLIALPMPTNADSTPVNNRTGVTGAWLIAVGQKAHNARMAWEFISHITCHESAKAMKEDGIPAAYENLLSPNESLVHAAAPRPAHPRWKEIEEAAGLRIQQAYWHTVSPDEALSRAAFDIRKILEAEEPPNKDKKGSKCKKLHTEPTRGKGGPQ